MCTVTGNREMILEGGEWRISAFFCFEQERDYVKKAEILVS